MVEKIIGMFLMVSLSILSFAQEKKSLYFWETGAPEGIPFLVSDELVEVGFTGNFKNYATADTWYPTWAGDGNLYSPYTDGAVDGVLSISDADWNLQGTENTTTGQAMITGNDPMNLQVTSLGVQKASSSPYRGRYPCGSLIHQDIWYYGTYCLGPESLVEHEGFPYNWPWLGPFVGFRTSLDFGKTWKECPLSPSKPLFGENGQEGNPVRIGSPHFVDFGQNMEHSPDGKAYLVAHGASEGPEGRRHAYNSWITGDQVYLIRVPPSQETINDQNAYEYFSGYNQGGEAIWTRDFEKIKPMLKWKDHMGCVTVTYNAPLEKYLMCVTDGGKTRYYMNTYILESDHVEGPWKMVRYFERFGEQAYFVNLPSKFISEDGLTLWMCYSANFGLSEFHFQEKPDGSRYALSLHEIKLIKATRK
jgi:hypothetical protein